MVVAVAAVMVMVVVAVVIVVVVFMVVGGRSDSCSHGVMTIMSFAALAVSFVFTAGS